MKNVTVYMGPMCGYCDAAKRLLNKKKIPYKEINIAIDEGKMEEMLKEYSEKARAYLRKLPDNDAKINLDNLIKFTSFKA